MSEPAIQEVAARFRDRIVGFQRVPGSVLIKNPKNWREHDDAQREALDRILDEVGFAGAALAYEGADGLILIDGHLRAEMAGDDEIPVLITDLSEEEADAILATFDPIGAMARTNEEALQSLIADLEFGASAVESIIGAELGTEPKGPEPLKVKKVRPLPSMTWVLVGIPTVRFMEISELVDAFHDVDGAIVHLTAND
jgi:hypothetical protein